MPRPRHPDPEIDELLARGRISDDQVREAEVFCEEHGGIDLTAALGQMGYLPSSVPREAMPARRSRRRAANRSARPIPTPGASGQTPPPTLAGGGGVVLIGVLFAVNILLAILLIALLWHRM